ncbi:hypothetical protein O6H91_23G048700 [Diphasiastrum complanatum]|uniref:Uncharacterized protein n=11 Tax=Diphasiastrum complanatum TaxID=34168 RepID=A0ACC2AA09_DIPCM|nr:hypothetical protein O6H91_23G019700 [Diphasiastrum complanatum]KAJ7513915.1 hypothetical protein O6H91_23G019700 [Diphasiastrum complanatum]KAJ7513916.1 hypothetical protein O6H91_23G019700 [Diphasiastrum complanatum]KAJ7513917.1 hypothetical protein O6H91_23G019700 [Diphasiastrum complanatum]KAJ7513918.1 hypothetical protein O6H91_23G019700 [Diphasiastrum complanatum]
MDWISIGALILAIAIPVAAGFAVATLGGGGDSDWYRSLDKPPWTPPNWVFPVMWTALYILMGVASWLVWKQGGFKAQGLPLGFYIAQLVLNLLWTPLFFGLHRFALAFAGIVLLWVVILVTIVLFWHVNHNAAYLLLPYIIWVTLAASINLYIWIKNPNDGRPGYQDISRALNQGQIS